MEVSPSYHQIGSRTFVDEGYLELVEVIGTGAYGSVWRGIDHRYADKPWRAVKSLRREGLDERQRLFRRREVTLHCLASDHPSIITLHRVVEEADYTYLVMDYGEEGDLFTMICDTKLYVGNDDLIRFVFLQIIEGVSHMHTYNIAHRDLKPENIVCSNDGQRVRICDFGLATSEAHSSEFGAGSTFYIAPEVYRQRGPNYPTYPTKSGDIWSLGVILVNLICGRNPWRTACDTDDAFRQFISNPNFLPSIIPISAECLEILKGVWHLDPSRRTTIDELRRQIQAIRTFSMTEEELRRVHAATARAQQARSTAGQKVSSTLAERGHITEAADEDMVEEEDEDEDEDEDVFEDYEDEEEGTDETEEDDMDWDAEPSTIMRGRKGDVSLPFDLDTDSHAENDIPLLWQDGGSPSPTGRRTRSTGSLPPTPLCLPDGALPDHLDCDALSNESTHYNLSPKTHISRPANPYFPA